MFQVHVNVVYTMLLHVMLRHNIILALKGVIGMAKPKMMDAIPLQFHVPPEQKKWVRRAAFLEGVPIASFLRRILRERYEKRNKV